MCWIFFVVEVLYKFSSPCDWLGGFENNERILKKNRVGSEKQLIDGPLHREHIGDDNRSRFWWVRIFDNWSIGLFLFSLYGSSIFILQWSNDESWKFY
jgi:hypothetical protein